ncbi:hypothetical protein [Streptomyces zhihengii]
MAERPLSRRTAQAVIDAAVFVKAPDWADTCRWHVTSGSQTLVVIAPSYGGTSRTGRNGWTWWLAEGAPVRHPAEATREKAAVAGLAAWQRHATHHTR